MKNVKLYSSFYQTVKFRYSLGPQKLSGMFIPHTFQGNRGKDENSEIIWASVNLAPLHNLPSQGQYSQVQSRIFDCLKHPREKPLQARICEDKCVADIRDGKDVNERNAEILKERKGVAHTIYDRLSMDGKSKRLVEKWSGANYKKSLNEAVKEEKGET